MDVQYPGERGVGRGGSCGLFGHLLMYYRASMKWRALSDVC